MRSSRRAVLDLLNRFLGRLNLRIETLTSARREEQRILLAAARGDFDEPRYVVPEPVVSSRHEDILNVLHRFAARFRTFHNAADNPVGYQFDNGFYSSPDAEVLYAIVRMLEPRRILEIGCGNSTKIVRQAIWDGEFASDHRCIDPYPRAEISALADQVIRQRIETADPGELAGSLAAGDMLFIDTSHEVSPANDVAYLYGRLLPRLAGGVVVHIHDIFLPYEYPLAWVKDEGLDWGEQYIVQALLSEGDKWEVLWPGYYLQRTLSDFGKHFPEARGRDAQSLWIRKRDTGRYGWPSRQSSHDSC